MLARCVPLWDRGVNPEPGRRQLSEHRLQLIQKHLREDNIIPFDERLMPSPNAEV
jgi:hypothetical protein